MHMYDKDILTHHLARLAMMTAEEQGIELSYEDAIKQIQTTVNN